MQIQPDETLDRLTSRLKIIQKRRGHRVASDDTLLAWVAARARPAARRLLDLGSGKGAVAMLLLGALPESHIVGLEALEMSHELAVRNALLNGLTGRWQPRLADLRDGSALAGEPPFDLITGAPPFMPVGAGVMPKHPQRSAGRFELRGGIEEYAAAAARHLAPGGRVVLLMDGLERSRKRGIRALESCGLCPHVVTAVFPFPGGEPVFRIFEAAASPLPERELSLAIRIARGGPYTAEFDAVRREMDCGGIMTKALT
jgi:tRNA1(Val) A37 N6-methylase TrmN6